MDKLNVFIADDSTRRKGEFFLAVLQLIQLSRRKILALYRINKAEDWGVDPCSIGKVKLNVDTFAKWELVSSIHLKRAYSHTRELLAEFGLALFKLYIIMHFFHELKR